MQQSYYSVIPAPVRRCRTLQRGAKELYGDITALCNEQGFCWASNQYFAGLYEVHVSTIQRWIKALEKKKFIDIIYLPVDSGTERRIYLREALPYIEKKVSGEKDKEEGGVAKMLPGGSHFCDPINTSDSFSKEKGASKIDEDQRRALIGIFSRGFQEIYNAKLKLTPKELGSIKNLAPYFLEDRTAFHEKLALLRAIATKKNKFQNWRYLPSQLLLHWNDLVPGCIMEDTPAGPQRTSTRPPVIKAPDKGIVENRGDV